MWLWSQLIDFVKITKNGVKSQLLTLWYVATEAFTRNDRCRAQFMAHQEITHECSTSYFMFCFSTQFLCRQKILFFQERVIKNRVNAWLEKLIRNWWGQFDTKIKFFFPCVSIQVNNYEIVINFFHISHNLTWYSAIVHKFTWFVQLMNWQNNSSKFV